MGRDGEVDRCDPVCETPCENGDCVGPDDCECHEGWTGDFCEEEDSGDEDYGMETTTEDPTTEGYGDDYGHDEDVYGDEENNGDDYEDDNDAYGDDAYGDDDGDDTYDDGEDHEDATDLPEAVDEDANGDEDGDGEEGNNGEESHDDEEDDGEDYDPQVGAYGGVSEVVPQVLVGTAALLMVKAL